MPEKAKLSGHIQPKDWNFHVPESGTFTSIFEIVVPDYLNEMESYTSNIEFIVDGNKNIFETELSVVPETNNIINNKVPKHFAVFIPEIYISNKKIVGAQIVIKKIGRIVNNPIIKNLNSKFNPAGRV